MYTQLDTIFKYEEETGEKITKEYKLEDDKNLIMTDIRSLLSYKSTYKEITNLVGKIRVLELYNKIKNDIKNNA